MAKYNKTNDHNNSYNLLPEEHSIYDSVQTNNESINSLEYNHAHKRSMIKKCLDVIKIMSMYKM